MCPCVSDTVLRLQPEGFPVCLLSMTFFTPSVPPSLSQSFILPFNSSNSVFLPPRLCHCLLFFLLFLYPLVSFSPSFVLEDICAWLMRSADPKLEHPSITEFHLNLVFTFSFLCIFPSFLSSFLTHENAPETASRSILPSLSFNFILLFLYFCFLYYRCSCFPYVQTFAKVHHKLQDKAFSSLTLNFLKVSFSLLQCFCFLILISYAPLQDFT